MDDDGSRIITGLMIFIVLAVANGILSAILLAARKINDSDLEKEESSWKIKRIVWAKEKIVVLRRINIAALTCAEIYIGCLAVYFMQTIKGNALHIAVMTGVMLITVLLFRAAVFGLGILFARGMGIRSPEIEEDVTEEEIISIVNEGQEQGVLEADEAEMINNIVEFGDKEAQDIMTHRKNIAAVSEDQSLSETLTFILSASYSRFPVYEESADNITGIIHLKDIMKYHIKGKYDDCRIKDIPNLIRPVEFIPETRKINQLFKTMQAKALHMVIVVDEYGQTAGLVALEDILEEIVGNIQDEYDDEDELITKQPDGSYMADGMALLEELEEELGIRFELEADIGTLNGYLIAKLDKIPDKDEKSIIEDVGYRFHILSVLNKTIEKVKIEPL